MEFVLWSLEGNFDLNEVADARVRFTHKRVCLFPEHIAIG